jgi:magnesium-transporting ATPase (P-type)
MLLALLLCYGGFTALCLSMDRHHADLLGRKPSTRSRQWLKVAGWVLLAISLCPAVSVANWALGLVEWFAVLMLSALLLVLLMPYRPRMALALAAVSLLASPIVVFVQS